MRWKVFKLPESRTLGKSFWNIISVVFLYVRTNFGNNNELLNETGQMRAGLTLEGVFIAATEIPTTSVKMSTI